MQTLPLRVTGWYPLLVPATVLGRVATVAEAQARADRSRLTALGIEGPGYRATYRKIDGTWTLTAHVEG